MAEMTGLSLGTTYRVRAYAVNSEGTAYGEEKSFTTLDHQEYTVSVSASPTSGGTMEGGGSYEEGASCTVRATAASGYNFVNWTEDGNQVSSNASYTFTVEGDRTLVANFTAGTYVISVSVNPENGGTATGAGGYEYGQSCTLRATANNGYTFTNWTENGSQVSTDASYTFTVNNDRTLVANFTQQITLPTVTTSQVTNITETSATGGGNVTDDGGATVTVRGICWSTSHNPTISDSHGTSGSGLGDYTCLMTNLTPNTTYYVRAYATNSQGTAYGNELSFTTAQLPTYTINVSASPTVGGSVSGGGTYQQGQTCTVYATSNSGYTFNNWTEYGNVVSTNANYSFAVNSNRSLVGNFSPNLSPWSLLATFEAPEAGHYGVVTDGQYIYTSNWGYNSAAHNFYKYDINGDMIEGFEIEGCGTLRGLAYDGHYFYGVANSSTVYCVDLANHALVGTFDSSYGAMRCITYDPQRDGFWVIGNWSGNLTLISRTGSIIQVGPEPSNVSDCAYYKDENGIEHVFCFNNNDNGVYDYNITTGTLGGSVFNFSNVPGFNSGTAGGCHVGEYNGKIAFYGDLQQDPNLIGIYYLRERR